MVMVSFMAATMRRPLPPRSHRLTRPWQPVTSGDVSGVAMTLIDHEHATIDDRIAARDDPVDLGAPRRRDLPRRRRDGRRHRPRAAGRVRVGHRRRARHRRSRRPGLRRGWARVRRWEAAAAMAVLGVDEHRVLGLPDGALADHDDEGVGAGRRGCSTTIQPDTILTFGPDGMTFHPDHIAVHRWVTDAWEQRGRPGRLLYATSTVEHLARFGELLRGVGHVHDRRAAGRASPPTSSPSTSVSTAGASTASSPPSRAMATQTGGLMATIDPQTLRRAGRRGSLRRRDDRRGERASHRASEPSTRLRLVHPDPAADPCTMNSRCRPAASSSIEATTTSSAATRASSASSVTSASACSWVSAMYSASYVEPTPTSPRRPRPGDGARRRRGT